jgi:hypothetical protein
MEADRMQQLIDLMVEIDKKLDVHIAEEKSNKQTLIFHDKILRGSEDAPSLPEQVRNNSKDIRAFKKVLWYVATPLLLAIGGGVLWIIVQGANQAAG